MMEKDILRDIKSKFGTNTPIFTSDFPDSGSPATRQYISRAVRAGRLERYQKGIYYFSTKTPWGKSLLSPYDVCKRKYISDEGSVFGYLTDTSFENAAGFTTQVSNVLTIRTNKTASREQAVFIGSQKVILKKPRMKIDNQNQKILQFLDLITFMPEPSFDRNIRALDDYCRTNEFTKEAFYRCIAAYPARTSKRVMEGRLYDAFT